jgi:hypothetical protein
VGTHETAGQQIGHAAEGEDDVEEVEGQTRWAVWRDVRGGEGAMVGLLADSNDWGQSCAVVAHT